ncbi:MAG TPA: methyltransferase dimerization domain-containing protein, partial [Chthonomonadaceae bacterium]|nr:methyltransferase dimerization domain-containing protein [Chthonomonadaceae bacterium]
MEQPTQTPVTPERVMRFAFGFAPPLMIEAAVTNGIFDSLDAGPKTAAEVAATTGASERGVRAILNGLTSIELLGKDAEGRYTLAPDTAKFLVSGKPTSLAGFYRHTSGQLIPKWLQMNEIVRTGRPAHAVNHQGDGAAFFVDFVEDLYPLNYPAASILGRTLGVGHAQGPLSVLDLAAGSGVWGLTLAQQSPHVRVTAIDWSEVLPVTRRVAERLGLAD